MFKLTTVAAAVAVLTLAAAPAFAEDSAVSTRLSVARVDFNDPAQVQKVYRDIRAQARYVCDTSATYDHDYDVRAEKACEAQTVAAAVQSINRTTLTRLDDAHNGRQTTELSQADLSSNTPGR